MASGVFLAFEAALAEVSAKIAPLPGLAPGRYTLQTDGAAKGNPGPAGAGAVIFEPDEEAIGEYSWYLGPLTNNAAEYSALILGLTVAGALGVRRLLAQVDSELVARQTTGQYQVKHEGLVPYYFMAKRLLSGFGEAVVAHVYRERNKAADRLSSRAASLGAKGLLGVFEAATKGEG
jgi:ribonuclease HI